MERNSELSLLGLALRGGRLAAGAEAVESAVRSRDVRLLVISSDASERTRKYAAVLSEQGQCLLAELPHTKTELGRALGRDAAAIAGVTDIGLANAVAQRLAAADPDRYAETAQRLEQKMRRAHERRELRETEKQNREAAKREQQQDRPKNRGPRKPSGKPEQGAGGPRRTSDKPERGAGGLRKPSGKPEQGAGEPRRPSGKPERGAGGPWRASGKPERSAGDPRRVSGKPERDAGGPRRASGKPDRSVEGVRRRSGGRDWNPGDPRKRPGKNPERRSRPGSSEPANRGRREYGSARPQDPERHAGRAQRPDRAGHSGRNRQNHTADRRGKRFGDTGRTPPAKGRHNSPRHSPSGRIVRKRGQ